MHQSGMLGLQAKDLKSFSPNLTFIKIMANTTVVFAKIIYATLVVFVKQISSYLFTLSRVAPCIKVTARVVFVITHKRE